MSVGYEHINLEPEPMPATGRIEAPIGVEDPSSSAIAETTLPPDVIDPDELIEAANQSLKSVGRSHQDLIDNRANRVTTMASFGGEVGAVFHRPWRGYSSAR